MLSISVFIVCTIGQDDVSVDDDSNEEQGFEIQRRWRWSGLGGKKDELGEDGEEYAMETRVEQPGYHRIGYRMPESVDRDKDTAECERLSEKVYSSFSLHSSALQLRE